MGGTVIFPFGVKLLAAEFPSLFGTANGDLVRRLCIKWGWPLVWGLGPNGAHDAAVLDQRVLDPKALRLSSAMHNMSLNSSVDSVFEELWQEVNKTRATRQAISPAQWSKWWWQLPALIRVSSGV